MQREGGDRAALLQSQPPNEGCKPPAIKPFQSSSPAITPDRRATALVIECPQWVESEHCQQRPFAYYLGMLKHLLVVILSALMGSTVGTLLWVAWEGGTGAPDPLGFITGFALATTIFTIPGAMLLMYLSFEFADRRVKLPVQCLLLLALGSLAGAAILAFIAPSFVALGALFGFATAVAFVGTMSGLGSFPSRVG